MNSYLKYSHLIKGENTHNSGADDAAIWHSAEAVTRIVRVRTFAVVTRNEDFSVRDYHVDFAGSVFFWPPSVTSASGIVGVETVGIFIIVDGDGTILYGDPFAGEGNDAFDNILIFNIRISLTGERSGSGAVSEDDNLTAVRDVFLSPEVGDRDWYAVDDDAIVAMQSIFHADADDVVRTEDKSVQYDGTQDDATDEY